MTELEILQLLLSSSDGSIDAINELTMAVKFLLITVLVFYVRWETKGGTFKR